MLSPKKTVLPPDPSARQVVKLLEKSLQLNGGNGVFNDTVVQVQQLLWVPWQPGPRIWVWVNTYRYIFSGMNIHFNPAMTWGSLGTRVLTHPHIKRGPGDQLKWWMIGKDDIWHDDILEKYSGFYDWMMIGFFLDIISNHHISILIDQYR